MRYSYEKIVDICSTVSACYSYPVWMIDIKPKLEKQLLFLPYEYGAIKIACLSASLVALRKFDDFFADRKPRRDDVAVSDFEYSSKEFLSIEERNEINKHIAHFTGTSFKNIDKNWNIIDMLTRLGKLMSDFLKYLLGLCTKEDKYTYFEISETMNFLEQKVKAMQFYQNQSS